MECIEFAIGDTVTLDRYNHVDDVEVVKVTGYGVIGWHENERLTYKMDVHGTTISSTGLCIMESENYEPCPAEERHPRNGAGTVELEEYWDKRK